MAQAQDTTRKGQQICLANQLLAASGGHRVQESYAMTIRLR